MWCLLPPLLWLTAAALVASSAPTAPSSAVIQLTDLTFEPLTQASSGATTGDWFIALTAPYDSHCRQQSCRAASSRLCPALPLTDCAVCLLVCSWCGHCQQLAPVWQQLAEELQGEVNVAALDATQETRTATRCQWA